MCKAVYYTLLVIFFFNTVVLKVYHSEPRRVAKSLSVCL